MEISFPQAISWQQKLFTANYTAHYFLDPASCWKDFSNLTIQVILPEGFHLDSTLDLAKTSPTTWQGEFSTLPSENLSLSLRPKFPFAFKYGTWRTGGELILLTFYGVVGLPAILAFHAMRAMYRRISLPK